MSATADDASAGQAESTAAMKYLVVVECPVVFPGENAFGMSSMDMLPRLGITAGLESRHIRIHDGRLTAVCIWKSVFCARLFFDAAWQDKAQILWEDAYRTRFEAIDGASAA